MMGQSIKVYFDFMTFTRKSCVARIKIAAISCLCCSETFWHQHRHATKMGNITLPNSSHKHCWPKLIKPTGLGLTQRFWIPPPSPAHSYRRPSSMFSHRNLQSRVGEDVCSCARSLPDVMCLFTLSLLSAEPVPRADLCHCQQGKLRPTNTSKAIPAAQMLYQSHMSMEQSTRK